MTTHLAIEIGSLKGNPTVALDAPEDAAMSHSINMVGDLVDVFKFLSKRGYKVDGLKLSKEGHKIEFPVPNDDVPRTTMPMIFGTAL